MKYEVVADYACVCGEGPLWHESEKRLYWTDISTGRLFRYSPATGQHEQIYQGLKVGGFTIQADGSLLLFREKGNIVVWREGKVAKTIVPAIPGEENNRFNDVAADPEGRVFCGTGGDGPPGRLYLLHRDGSLDKLLDNVGCSNGIGFTPDLAHMYYTDSSPRVIYRLDYDRKTGRISNQQPWVSETRQEYPDGLTVDARGDVWSARWDGSCVVRYSPEGVELQRMSLPTPKISSVMFGGQDLSDMYLTSAGGNDKVKNGPHAGALFRVQAGVKGLPEFLSRIGL